MSKTFPIIIFFSITTCLKGYSQELDYTNWKGTIFTNTIERIPPNDFYEKMEPRKSYFIFKIDTIIGYYSDLIIDEYLVIERKFEPPQKTIFICKSGKYGKEVVVVDAIERTITAIYYDIPPFSWKYRIESEIPEY